ncbi:thiamine pyrophosphate-binding protein [Chloroflexota bacterium]
MTIKGTLLTADRILDELKKCGITHVVCLPDREGKFVYEAMIRHPDFTVVPVCREGEAIPIAAGLMLGGKEPMVMQQNTGFFESGDSVRGMALDLQLPLLLLINYRGWRRNSPMTDSAAIFIEPILDAWGIKHYLVETDEEIERISFGFKEARETRRPVAILFGREEGES